MSDDPILAALARLEAGQSAIPTRLERLEAGQAAMCTRAELIETRSAIMERIDRLQHTVDLLKDDIVVNYGSSDRTERIAKSASEETRAPRWSARCSARSNACKPTSSSCAIGAFRHERHR